jgi:hypothetical protein
MSNTALHRLPEKQQLALGVVAGTACGLLFASLVLVWFGVEIFLYLFFFSFGLLVFAPLGYCVKVGIAKAREGMLPSYQWSTVTLIALTILPLSLTAPIGLRLLHLHVFGIYAIPFFPNSEKLETETVALADSVDGPRISFRYRSTEPADEVMTFFLKELQQKKWTKGPEMFRKHNLNGTQHWFEKIEFWGGDRLSISFLANGEASDTTFVVTCYIVRQPPLI